MTRRSDRARRSRTPAAPRTRGGWRAHLLVFGALLLTWIMLWGSVQPGLVLLGVVCAVAVLVLFPLPHMDFRFGIHPIAALALVLRFLADVVVSSVHVAWVAVRPRLPDPQVVRVPLAGTSDLVQHVTALAVSLVPGSLVVDAETDDGRVPSGAPGGRRSLVVHVLDADERTVERTTRQVLAQERRILAALGADEHDDRDGGGAR